MELDKQALQDSLIALFDAHGVSVGVGLTATGVAIRSQDDRVDAINLGHVAAYAPVGDDLADRARAALAAAGVEGNGSLTDWAAQVIEIADRLGVECEDDSDEFDVLGFRAFGAAVRELAGQADALTFVASSPQLLERDGGAYLMRREATASRMCQAVLEELAWDLVQRDLKR